MALCERDRDFVARFRHHWRNPKYNRSGGQGRSYGNDYIRWWLARTLNVDAVRNYFHTIPAWYSPIPSLSTAGDSSCVRFEMRGGMMQQVSPQPSPLRPLPYVQCLLAPTGNQDGLYYDILRRSYYRRETVNGPLFPCDPLRIVSQEPCGASDCVDAHLLALGSPAH